MITATLLATVLGGLTSIIPGVIEYMNRKEELRHEKELFALRAQYLSAEAKKEIDVINAKALVEEGDSLRRHDSSLDGNGGFINAMRASVRPVVTYLFLMMFLGVKLVAAIAFIQASAAEGWLNSALAWAELMPIIWDENTSAIFGAIIGFWFGGRAVEKMRGV